MRTDLYILRIKPGANEQAIVESLREIAGRCSVSATNISGAPWPTSQGREMKVQVKGDDASCVLFAAARPANMKHLRTW